MAEEARAEYIKTSCEAYILDKAKDLGVEIRAIFSLNGDLIPETAEISGTGGIREQKRLQKILMMDLGIPKENQIWIWNQESNSS